MAGVGDLNSLAYQVKRFSDEVYHSSNRRVAQNDGKSRRYDF
jgi:hypothetical protein